MDLKKKLENLKLELDIEAKKTPESTIVSDPQIRVIYKYLFDNPSTMRECEIATNIVRPNICRYIATMQQLNQVFIVQKRLCKFTKQPANVYSTNPIFEIEKPNKYQLELDF